MVQTHFLLKTGHNPLVALASSIVLKFIELPFVSWSAALLNISKHNFFRCPGSPSKFNICENS